MTLHVIRHASAGVRAQNGGIDLQRPLDVNGQAQSRTIAATLGGQALVRLLSSEAVRCRQTLAALSTMVGLPIEIHPDLLEGASTTATVELFREMATEPGDVALCSHGDVIPAALSSLAHEGVDLTGGRGCDKGSIWELEVRDQDIVSARYRSASNLSQDLAST